MKLLVDECVARDVSTALAVDFDVRRVAISYRGWSDERLLELAQAENLIMLTEDKRFGQLAMEQQPPQAAVVILALDLMSPAEKAARCIEAFKIAGIEFAGRISIIRADGIRQRILDPGGADAGHSP